MFNASYCCYRLLQMFVSSYSLLSLLVFFVSLGFCLIDFCIKFVMSNVIQGLWIWNPFIKATNPQPIGQLRKILEGSLNPLAHTGCPSPDIPPCCRWTQSSPCMWLLWSSKPTETWAGWSSPAAPPTQNSCLLCRNCRDKDRNMHFIHFYQSLQRMLLFNLTRDFI